MPLTEKGSEIKQAMEKEYGPEKGERVFYASANKGTITGVHDEPSEYRYGGADPAGEVPQYRTQGTSGTTDAEYTQVDPELTLAELQRRNEEYWRQKQSVPLQPDVQKVRPV
jgi:hypothetical protein